MQDRGALGKKFVCLFSENLLNKKYIKAKVKSLHEITDQGPRYRLWFYFEMPQAILQGFISLWEKARRSILLIISYIPLQFYKTQLSKLIQY